MRLRQDETKTFRDWDIAKTHVSRHITFIQCLTKFLLQTVTNLCSTRENKSSTLTERTFNRRCCCRWTEREIRMHRISTHLWSTKIQSWEWAKTRHRNSRKYQGKAYECLDWAKTIKSHVPKVTSRDKTHVSRLHYWRSLQLFDTFLNFKPRTIRHILSRKVYVAYDFKCHIEDGWTVV